MIVHMTRLDAVADDKVLRPVLRPHADPDPSMTDWNECGVAAFPGGQCMAVAAISALRCRKQAVLAMMFLPNWTRPQTGVSVPFGLCGGHFIVHRDGKDVRLDEEAFT